ncbi:MAG: PmoA family protein [Planctomycetes bacterium]|nr:PmoA family protein [Planctomycetota bacterium]
MSDLFLFADVESEGVARRDAVVSAAIDFRSFFWHAARQVGGFAPWSLAVHEVDSQGQSTGLVPHQWDGERLHWKLPGDTPAGCRRRFQIACASSPGPRPAKNDFTDRVVPTDLGQEILFSCNEQELCRYRYRDPFKPYFFPVYGPHGNVVRDRVEDEEGHSFHHGLWIAYGSIDQNSANLWCESDSVRPRRGPTGRMQHESFEAFSFGWVFGWLRERLAYQKPGGHVFAREWRTVRVTKPNRDSLILDLEIRLQEPDDTGPRNTMFSARVAPTMRLVDASRGWTRKQPLDRPGKIEKGEAWTDYSGPVGDGWDGVALFDHPANPDFSRPPTATDYGLISLSRTYPPGDGYRGSTVTYRYRAYVHHGDAEDGRVREAWLDYAFPCWVTITTKSVPK